MNKLHSSLIFTSILMALPYQMDAWSKNGSAFEEPQIPEQTAAIYEPDNRVWMLEADYLFWKPYQDDLTFATRRVLETVGPTTFLKVRPESPEYNLSSGVRLGIGGYLSDTWDISVRGTYYYTDGSNTSEANGGSGWLFPAFFPGFEGESGTKATGSWALNYGLLDFTIGREYCLTKRVRFHPFIGIRNVWLNQTLKGVFTGIHREVSPPDSITRAKNRFSNDIWGIGPRVGFDLSYYFCKEWSLKGGLSGAFVYGHYSIDQKAKTTLTNLGNGSVTFNELKGTDSEHVIRSNLDAYIGMGWDRWFNNGKNRVYVALLAETSYWYHINQYMDLDISAQGLSEASPIGVNLYKRNGDLAFFGGTIHFQIDF